MGAEGVSSLLQHRRGDSHSCRGVAGRPLRKWATSEPDVGRSQTLQRFQERREAVIEQRAGASVPQAHNDLRTGHTQLVQRQSRDIDDIFAVQDEIAKAVVENLKVKLLGAQDAPLVTGATEDLEASNWVLQAGTTRRG